jgi:hypothetical protein
MIEECLGTASTTPTGNVDVIGDADDGDMHSGGSSAIKVDDVSGWSEIDRATKTL